MIGPTRSAVTDTTNTAAITVRNSSASHNRGRDTVAAMSHTGELKKTRIVSKSSGSARVTIDPAAARFDVVICTAQPRIEPAPHAVSPRMAAITMASTMRSTRTRGLGPPRMPPAIAMVTATVAATLRPRTVEIRDTHQPTNTAMGSTRTSSASTNHSVRVGWPSMSMVCWPVTATTSAELAMKTANPASTGAERGHSRRTRAPGLSTAGRPRSRNHASAARRCVTSIMKRPPGVKTAVLWLPRSAVTPMKPSEPGTSSRNARKHQRHRRRCVQAVRNGQRTR